MKAVANVMPGRWLVPFTLLGLLLGGCQTTSDVSTHAADVDAGSASLAALAVSVSRAENRAVSFTNKRSAYYYTQTHRNDHPEHAYFRGFNVAGRRIFSEYQIRIDGQPLDPQTATVTVQPDVMLRQYPNGVTEALRLFDDQDVVEVEVTGNAKIDIALELLGDTITLQRTEQGTDWYVAKQDAASTGPDFVAVGRVADRFLIATAPTGADAQTLLAEAVAHATAWRASASWVR